MKISKNIENLMMNLQILPGVGPKTAKRLALFLLGENKKDARENCHALLMKHWIL